MNHSVQILKQIAHTSPTTLGFFSEGLSLLAQRRRTNWLGQADPISKIVEPASAGPTLPRELRPAHRHNGLGKSFQGLVTHVLATYRPRRTRSLGSEIQPRLATVYGIVKQSDGSISVDSDIGRGTNFKVYLPRVEGTVHTHSDVRLVTAAKGWETILVVEDEGALRPQGAERAGLVGCGTPLGAVPPVHIPARSKSADRGLQ